jgi:hypothetical protein
MTGSHGPGTTGDKMMDKVTPGQNTYGSTDPMNSGSAVTGRHGMPGSEGHQGHHSGAGTALGAGALGAGAGGLAAHQYNQRDHGATGHHGSSPQDATTKDKIMDKITPGTNTYGTTQPGVSPTHGSTGSGLTGSNTHGTHGTHGTGMTGTHGTHGPGTATDRAVDKVTPGTNTYGSTDPTHSGSAVTGQRGLPGSEGRHGPTTGAGLTGSHGTHGPGTTGDRMMDKVTPGQNTYGSTDPMNSGSAVTGRHGAPGSEGHHSGAGTALGAGALGAGAGGLAGHHAGQHHGSGMTGTHGPGTTGDRMMDKVTPGQNTYGSTDPMNSGSAVTGQHGLPGSEGRHGPTTGSGLTGTHGTGMTGSRGPGTTTDKMMDKVTPGSNTYGSTDPMHSGSAMTGKHGLPGSEGRTGTGMAGGMTGTHGPGTTGDKMMDKVTPGTNTYGSTDPMHSGSAVTGQHGLPGTEGRSVTGTGAGVMGSQSHHQGTTSDRMMDKVTPGTNTYGTTQPGVDPAMAQHDKIMPGGNTVGSEAQRAGHNLGSAPGVTSPTGASHHHAAGTEHHRTGSTGSGGGLMQKIKDKVEDVVGGGGTGHHNTGAHPTAVGQGVNPTAGTGTTTGTGASRLP